MAETDETLYRRFLIEHNEEDFRVLLERHREQLLLFLNGYVHNLEDAEELMLDAFAEAAAGSSVFRGQSSFRTWLFSIGKKQAFMYLRKARLRRDRQNLEPGEVPLPELDILRGERDRQLYRALGELNEDYRQALTLLYFEEMSHEEAGRVMGKTRRQMYNLAERGRKALRDTLERIGYDHEAD